MSEQLLSDVEQRKDYRETYAGVKWPEYKQVAGICDSTGRVFPCPYCEMSPYDLSPTCIDAVDFGAADYAPKSDMVNHPLHYNQAGIEVITVIETYWPESYHMGNVLKYCLRAPYKHNELEDLKKARWYLDRFISMKENDDGNTVSEVPEEQGYS
jgi:hypothetical protein